MARRLALFLVLTIAPAMADPVPAPHLPSLIDRQFYQPTKDRGQRPSDRGWKYEDVNFTSADGIQLHGWFIPAPSGTAKAKGSVLYVHGINGAIGDLIGSVRWLRDIGWNVFLFDYRGYGQSDGAPSRIGIIEDTQAALKHLKGRKDIDQSKILAMGYSLGGSTLLTAMGREETDGIQLLIAVSSFSSYRKVIADNLGWKASLLDNNSWAPEKFIGNITATPIVLVHGRMDEYIPLHHANTLLKAAKPDATTLIPVDTGTHQAPFGEDPQAMIKQVLGLMEKAVH